MGRLCFRIDIIDLINQNVLFENVELRVIELNEFKKYVELVFVVQTSEYQIIDLQIFDYPAGDHQIID